MQMLNACRYKFIPSGFMYMALLCEFFIEIFSRFRSQISVLLLHLVCTTQEYGFYVVVEV